MFSSTLRFLRTKQQLISFYNKRYINMASVGEESKSIPTPAHSMPPFMDSHGRKHDYLRISLTERCNLRCQYCMPAEGVPLSAKSALLSRDELVRLARVFAAGGVRKVRLTGGEPTLRADLAELVGELRALPGLQAVAITTNGLVLTRRLPALQRAGLSALNVSLDSLRAERYERMARRPGLSRVLAGIDLALQLGYSPVKINVVLMKGFNDDEINDFVEYTRDRDVEIRFIEFMPFSGNKWDDSLLVPHRVALRAVLRRHPRLEPQPPRPHDTAVVWRAPAHAGTVGFISSMTQPFCSSCNRLRLTADGGLKVCLFGAAEVSLRDALRAGADDAELDALVRAALRHKRAQHAGRCAAASPAPRARPPLTPPAVRRRGHAGALARPPHDPHRRLAARGFCTTPAGGAGAGAGGADDAAGAFSHLDAGGRARMVDVGAKQVTEREAEAECSLQVSARVLRLLRDARLPKGDALTVARVAGALGAKRTAELLPMCHPLPLHTVRVRVLLPRGAPDAPGALLVRARAAAHARTGVEMEALTGAAVAALALYDMCKSVDPHMRITDLRVLHKSGGKSSWVAPPPPLRAPTTTPHDETETYAPSDLAHF